MAHDVRRRSNWVLSNPLSSEIARGKIANMSDFSGMGERNHIEISVNGVDLWGGTTTSPMLPNQLGGERMVLTSASHDDRLNGTGVQKVEIDYLDAAGNEQYETTNLNGTAWVRTVGTNLRFINAIHSTQVGCGTVASGDISIFAEGTIGSVYNMISIGANMSLSAQKMVPLGKTLYLHEWSCSAMEQSVSNRLSARIKLRTTSIHGTRVLNTFLFTDTAQLNNSVYNKIFSIPKLVPSLSIIKVTAWVNGTAIYAAASWGGSLETNEE